MNNAKDLSAFKDQSETSSFSLFLYKCEEAVEQNAALPFTDPLRIMFENKLNWYE